MSDVYTKMKIVVSLIDEETGDTIGTTEMPVRNGESETTVELRARKMLMKLLLPDSEEEPTPNAATASGGKRVTNAKLQQSVEAQGDVIQSMIRLLHSKGLMSESMLKALAKKMDY